VLPIIIADIDNVEIGMQVEQFNVGKRLSDYQGEGLELFQSSITDFIEHYSNPRTTA